CTVGAAGFPEFARAPLVLGVAHICYSAVGYHWYGNHVLSKISLCVCVCECEGGSWGGNNKTLQSAFPCPIVSCRGTTLLCIYLLSRPTPFLPLSLSLSPPLSVCESSAGPPLPLGPLR